MGGLKDKLFFFAAQEWVNFFQIQTNTATVPTALMRTGNFSELLDPNNGFFTNPGVRTIIDPTTGQPFPGNIIPTNRLSPNGLAMLNTFPLPTQGFRQGTANLIMSSDNPQDQRKDNIRFDYRLNQKHQFSYRYGKYTWTAIDAFRGTFPYARTDWDRPNVTQTASWTAALSSTLINEFSFTHSLDEVFINVWEGTDLFQRSKYGITYPYIFPQNKEIPDKIPTITIANFSEIDGGPYPSSSRGPIYTFNNATTYLKGRHTFKAGVIVEYSGQDDFDQINVQPIPGSTNNQNGRFQFPNDTAGVNSTGVGIANAALGMFNSYAEIGQRALTKYRSLSTDLFVQDSWRPTGNLTIEGGVRWSYWPPWYSLTNNIATFDPAAYDTSNQAVVSPTTGRIVSGPRYNGIVLPGNGFEGDGNDLAVASDPAVLALFVGAPRGFAKTHANVFEPRIGAAYSLNDKTIVKMSSGVFHNRVTVSDSMFLGGNPPFQPQVGVSNGRADDPGGVGGAGSLPFGMTAIDRVFKHPTAYMWSAGVQRQVPFNFIVDVTYVGRRGLYNVRERDINQLLPGTVQANPGVNVAALRPYKGYGVIRLSENAAASKYHSLQISADRRYTNGFKFGVAYTLGKSQDDASGLRDVLFNNYDASGFWGNSGFDRRHSLNFYYIYDLPFYRDQAGVIGKVLGGWQISGATFMRSGTPLWVTEGADIAGTGDTSGIRGMSTAIRRATRTRSSRPAPLPIRISGSIRRCSRGRQQARSATARGTTSTIPASINGTSRCSRTSIWAGRRPRSSARRFSISSTTRTGTARSEPDERYVRSCHWEGRRPPGHSAQRSLHVLTPRITEPWKDKTVAADHADHTEGRRRAGHNTPSGVFFGRGIRVIRVIRGCAIRGRCRYG